MRRSFLLLIFSFCVLQLSAQDPKLPLINGEFNNTPFARFVNHIEASTPYFFYFDARQVDSIRVNVKAVDLPLEELLKKVFLNTDFHFSVDRQQRVYITRKFQIVTTLPEGFGTGSGNDTGNKQLLVLGEEDEKEIASTPENKLYEVGIKTNTIKPGRTNLSGYVRNEKSSEPVVNATIYLEGASSSISTDAYGYYTLALPSGRNTLNIFSPGMKDAKFQLIMYSDGKLDFSMKEQVSTLKEVIVSTQKVSNIKRVQMGVERLNIETIKRVPTVFGEADVLRVVTTLPGVKTVGEASTGFNVRGGSADQNLVLLNDATIYNPSHFFGMFSAFNPEIIKDIELYKSSIPAEFGGRLSSVLDISTREGNKKEFTGSAGIGLVTSRFNIEGPIVKDKTSFILGGRTTYANWLMKLLPDPYDQAKASFNDGNLVLNHRINPNNDIFITGYFSNDRFNLASDTTYGYSNRNGSIKWKHNFNPKLISYFTAGLDEYKYSVNSDQNKLTAYDLNFDIRQLNFKSDFSYLLDSRHTFDFGASSILYRLRPGSFTPRGKESLVNPDIVAPEQALESAIYFGDRFNITSDLSLNAGIRYSVFNYLGARNVNYYTPGLPKEEDNIAETREFKKGSIINTYHGPEYRLSLRYAINDGFSIKAAYNTLRQYIHMLSNTMAIAPTDIWKLSDPNIKPQQGNQVSLGFYKNLKSNTIETSVEIYYKQIKDYLDYKPGASLILNHNVETEVINTKGKAYGAEFMVKKPGGKLNGWVSYTFSRILLQANDPDAGISVNNGAWYPANYDKPHDATAVGNFRVNHRFSISLNMTYSTGRPITLPIGRYVYGGAQRVLYSDRNSYRIPDYFRADFSMNIDGNFKANKTTRNSWTIGVYNLTGRRNPFSVYYVSENGFINGYKLSIFGNMIPFINYNIRF
ncbi:MAG: carboxypeptidase-like regulatory domain-containing protein [Flavisolibacter sp.]|jgi:hypothetical protein|nr:carboxypeptidase-like regulatory domain-containing protein [Flavisolibacter sp.]